MKINIVAVGKIKEEFFVRAIDEYSKRLQKFCEFHVIEVPEATQETGIQKKNEAEGKSLLARCKGIIICLDRQGKEVSSEQFSKLLDEYKLSGASEFSFVIGGSNGLSDEVLSRANMTLSFGKVTFPHQLFRVILSEQLYRAFTISCGHPYHK